MPMVSESSSDPDISLPIRRNTTLGSVNVSSGRHRSQVGYRTRALTREEENSIRKPSIAGNVTSLIGFYNEAGYQYAIKHNRANTVNDRDYTETFFGPAQFEQTVRFKNLSTNFLSTDSVLGNWAISGHTASLMPAAPSSGSLYNEASGMMRRSVPTAQGFNLYRFLGELRDAPAFFRAANYRPKTAAEAGGSYLNYVFGIKPTQSDLLSAADSIIRAVPKVRQVLREEKSRVSTRKRRLLWQVNTTTVYNQKFANQQLASQSSFFYGLGIKWSYVTPVAVGQPRDLLTPRFSIEVVGSQALTQFSTWEYFVPRPAEIHTRLDAYKARAEALLGEGASIGTAYDLTPYSWLVDWFIDIGGLLHYQQAVGDNGVAAVANGYSLYERLDVKSALMSPGIDFPNGTYAVDYLHFSPESALATYTYKHHVRRGGSPYSISPTWSMSPQQWAISGAMGLSRSAGVPIKRV